MSAYKPYRPKPLPIPSKEKIKLAVKVEHSMQPKDFTVKDRATIMNTMMKYKADTLIINFEKNEAAIAIGDKEFDPEKSQAIYDEMKHAFEGYDNLTWVHIRPVNLDLPPGLAIQHIPDIKPD